MRGIHAISRLGNGSHSRVAFLAGWHLPFIITAQHAKVKGVVALKLKAVERGEMDFGIMKLKTRYNRQAAAFK
jgi:hypothetical protein